VYTSAGFYYTSQQDWRDLVEDSSFHDLAFRSCLACLSFFVFKFEFLQLAMDDAAVYEYQRCIGLRQVMRYIFAQ